MDPRLRHYLNDYTFVPCGKIAYLNFEMHSDEILIKLLDYYFKINITEQHLYVDKYISIVIFIIIEYKTCVTAWGLICPLVLVTNERGKNIFKHFPMS